MCSPSIMDMNYRLFSFLDILLAIAGASLLSCSRISEPGLSKAEKPSRPPALVIDQDSPLLLEEPAGTKKVLC